MLLLFCAINAQESKSPLPSTAEIQVAEDEQCIRRYSPLVVISFSALNGSKYIKNLTSKDLEVYEEDKIQRIEFFKFDELENQYKLGFLQEDLIYADKNREVKVKLKKEIKEHYGNIVVNELSKKFLD